MLWVLCLLRTGCDAEEEDNNDEDDWEDEGG
jgi:hypothetical protein